MLTTIDLHYPHNTTTFQLWKLVSQTSIVNVPSHVTLHPL